VSGLHPSHETRFSDASTYDEVCVLCGATDQVPGGWGDLAHPCPKARPPSRDRLALELAGHLEDDPRPLDEE
jgi:hypothetical protein